jgi:hypothetical protein
MKLRPWPREPDEAPSADEIARAYVAAARELDDVARLAELADVDAYRRLTTRARWLALAALDLLWPRVGLSALARKLGYEGSGHHAALISARQASRWSPEALDSVIRAI